MKKIYLIIGIITSMLLSSCEDFLTTYPQNQLTAGTFFKTDDDFAKPSPTHSTICLIRCLNCARKS